MTDRLSPRPYIVTVQDGEGSEHEERVMAYDLSEALGQASVRLIARKAPEPLTALDVQPDLDALAEHRAVETKRMSNLLANLRGREQ